MYECNENEIFTAMGKYEKNTAPFKLPKNEK